MLRLVLVKDRPREGWATEGFEDLCLVAEDWSSSEEDDTYLHLTFCLLLSACFLGLVGDIWGSSDST